MSNTKNNKKRVLSTPINAEVCDAFKDACTKIDIPMNTLLEMFMEAFANGEFEISYRKSIDGKLKGRIDQIK